MKHLALVIAVLAFFVLGCGLFNRLANSSTNVATNDGSTTSSKPTSGDAALPSGNAREDLITASKKFIELPKFRANMDTSGTNQFRMRLDYVAPDRFHIFFLDNSGQAKSESVMIGGDMYMKFGGRWQKLAGAVKNNKVPNLRDFFNEEGLKNLKEVDYVGDETVAGENAHVYSYHSDRTMTNQMAPNPYTSKIWVGANDGLPKKIEVTYEGGEMKSATITYDYSSDISVEPPA